MTKQERFINTVQLAWQAGRGFGPFPLRDEILAGNVSPTLVTKAHAILREIDSRDAAANAEP